MVIMKLKDSESSNVCHQSQKQQIWELILKQNATTGTRNGFLRLERGYFYLLLWDQEESTL